MVHSVRIFMFLTVSYAVFSLFHVSYIQCAQSRTPNMKIEKLIESEGWGC